jgi:hypothetical protein
MEVKFVFNEAGEDEGLNHPGIEHYMGAPYAGIARECGQNSRDAKTGYPVRIRITARDIPSNSIPGFDQLRITIDRCLAEAVQGRERGEKPRKFFENARKIAAAATVKVLEVSDSNTTGLLVTASRTSAFDALVKATGVSAVKSDDSGGSFGIGKFAAFAPSELRTVFYSTAYASAEGGTEFRFQGKSILTSHTDATGTARRSIGYWGAPGYNAISNPEKCPDWVRRSEHGTSVFSLGFRHSEDWPAQLAASVVQNFFLAIRRGEMVFDIEGFPALDESTLPAFFQDGRLRAAAESIGREEDFQLAHLLYRCATDSAATVDSIPVATGGSVTLRMLVGDALPKSVAIMRNGMMITDNLAHFGEKFRRFPRCRDFIALVEPADVPASKQFKSMENPSHDALTTERIADASERRNLHQAMVKLSRDIRAAIRSKTTAPSQDQVDITELNEFFGGIDTGDQSGENPLDDPETQTIVGQIRSSETPPPGSGTGAGSLGGTRKGKKSRKRTRRIQTGGRWGGGQELVFIDPRNHVINNEPTMRRIYFTPKTTGRAVIQIEALGITDGDDPLALPVVSCSGAGAVARAGHVELPVTADTRITLDVTFAESYSGPITLRADAKVEPQS